MLVHLFVYLLAEQNHTSLTSLSVSDRMIVNQLPFVLALFGIYTGPTRF